MVKLYDGGVYLVNGNEIVPEAEAARVEQMTGKKADPAEAKKGTIAYSITQVRTLRGQARVVAEKVVRRAWTLNMSDSGAER